MVPVLALKVSCSGKPPSPRKTGMDGHPSFKNLYLPSYHLLQASRSWDINLPEPSYWFVLLSPVWPYHPLHATSQGHTHFFL